MPKLYFKMNQDPRINYLQNKINEKQQLLIELAAQKNDLVLYLEYLNKLRSKGEVYVSSTVKINSMDCTN